jgi:hypothetical protein
MPGDGPFANLKEAINPLATDLDTQTRAPLFGGSPDSFNILAFCAINDFRFVWYKTPLIGMAHIYSNSRHENPL